MGETEKSTRLYVDIVKHLPNFKLNVQLEVGTEKLGLLGSSGSGKSMTLKCIAGIECPDEGSIILGDEVLFDAKKKINKPSRERKMGYLFQNYALFPHMTVIQNIMTGMLGLSKKDKEIKTQKLMEELHLLDCKKSYPRELSGGQQQRVALGRMLGSDPNVLMFDEPFSALDYHLKERLQQQFLDLLEERKVPAVVVSHDIDEVYRLCDKIAIIQDGKIDSLGTKKEIFEKPTQLSAARLTGCKNISRIKWLKDNEVLAIDWDIVLKVPDVPKSYQGYAGIRAHHLVLTGSKEENAFCYKIIKTSETRFGCTTVFGLKETSSIYEGAITLESDKTIWEAMKDNGMPKYIKLPKDKIMLLRD